MRRVPAFLRLTTLAAVCCAIVALTDVPGQAASRTRTWTNRQGQTGTAAMDRTWDQQTQTATTNRSAAGPRGRTASSAATTTRTEDGYSTTGSYQTGGGRSGTLQSSGGQTDAGRARSSSVTNQAGQTYSKDVEYQKTDSGYQKNVTATGPNGKTNSRSKDVFVYRPKGE